MKKYLGFLGILRYFLYLCNMKREVFIEKSIKVHGDKYIYTEIPEEVNSRDDVTIICKKHGPFTQNARTHYRGHGCSNCKAEKTQKALLLNTKKFLERYHSKFGDVYDTSLVEYKDFETNVKVVCPKHGIFEKSPHALMRGKGCPKCGFERRIKKKTWSKEKFIIEAKKVHGNLYRYDNVVYIKQADNVIITCPIHGDFQQTPRKHLMGSGCPKCNSSKLELTVNNILLENNIEFIYQGKKRKIDWIENLSLDFFIPNLNIAIECQGGQHFIAVQRFGGEKELTKRIENDSRKRELCKANGVRLIYFLDEEYNKYMKEDDIYFNDVNSLIEYIKNVKS